MENQLHAGECLRDLWPHEAVRIRNETDDDHLRSSRWSHYLCVVDRLSAESVTLFCRPGDRRNRTAQYHPRGAPNRDTRLFTTEQLALVFSSDAESWISELPALVVVLADLGVEAL